MLPVNIHIASDGPLEPVSLLRAKQRDIPMATHYLISKEVLETVL